MPLPSASPTPSCPAAGWSRYDKIQAEKALAEEDAIQAQPTEVEEEPPKPTLLEQFEQYKPIVIAAVTEDTAYRNACGHSDRENAVIEGNAAVRRAVLNSGDMELIRLFSDVPEFRQRLHREIFDETYPKLHELLRPLSQSDIDEALQKKRERGKDVSLFVFSQSVSLSKFMLSDKKSV